LPLEKPLKPTALDDPPSLDITSTAKRVLSPFVLKQFCEDKLQHSHWSNDAARQPGNGKGTWKREVGCLAQDLNMKMTPWRVIGSDLYPPHTEGLFGPAKALLQLNVSRRHAGQGELLRLAALLDTLPEAGYTPHTGDLRENLVLSTSAEFIFTVADSSLQRRALGDAPWHFGRRGCVPNQLKLLLKIIEYAIGVPRDEVFGHGTDSFDFVDELFERKL
jgi:hypothetical protein